MIHCVVMIRDSDRRGTLCVPSVKRGDVGGTGSGNATPNGVVDTADMSALLLRYGQTGWMDYYDFFVLGRYFGH